MGRRGRGWVSADGWMDGGPPLRHLVRMTQHEHFLFPTSSRDGGPTLGAHLPTNSQAPWPTMLLLLQDPIKYVTHPHRHPSSIQNGNKAK